MWHFASEIEELEELFAKIPIEVHWVFPVVGGVGGYFYGANTQSAYPLGCIVIGTMAGFVFLTLLKTILQVVLNTGIAALVIALFWQAFFVPYAHLRPDANEVIFGQQAEAAIEQWVKDTGHAALEKGRAWIPRGARQTEQEQGR